jgi:hypothetical protein
MSLKSQSELWDSTMKIGKIPTGETGAYTVVQMTHENGRKLHKEKENLTVPFVSH